MMIRRLSLIVPILSAIVAVSTASAQPRQEVGPWSTMERVGETLQERRSEAVDRIEESYPTFYARNSERLENDEPIVMTPLRIGGWADGPVTIGFFGPVASASTASDSNSTSGSSSNSSKPESTPAAPAPKPTSSPVIPYQPLVLGSLFGGDGVQLSTPIRVYRPTTGMTIEPVDAEASPARPTPAPRPAADPQPKPRTEVPTVSPSQPSPTPAEPPAQPATTTKSQSSDAPKPASVMSRLADAFLNFTDGPFPAAHTLTEGSPRSWYKSPVVTDLLGRSPNESEKQEFKNEVLSKVEESFRKSGLDVDLTIDPSRAAHTLSVVSGAKAVDNPDAIGIADIGGDGFTFIDNFDADAIETMSDLETAVANNISHELMHAFGVDYHDESGTAIDSGRIRWDLLASDDLSFSNEAVELLSSSDFKRRWDDALMASHQVIEHGQGCSCHSNGALATPEPTTIAMWTLTLVGAAWSGNRWRIKRA